MASGFESFLVSLCLAVLKRAAVKAGKETKEYIDEALELRKNKKKSGEYEKVVSNPNATREERRNAENSAFDN